MRNRQGYMINPLTGRQVKMNGKVAKNVYKMVGGAQTVENNSLLVNQPSNSTDLSQAQIELNEQSKLMEQSLNEQKAQVSAAEEAMQTAQKAQEDARQKEEAAQAAIDTASNEREAALERESDVKEDLNQLGKVLENLSSVLDKTAKKANDTDTSPFCTFDRLDKSLGEEEKEKIKSEEGKKLFDEMNKFIGSVSNLVSTTVNYLGLFSNEMRGRRVPQQNNNMVENSMLGGGKRRKNNNKRSARKNK